MWDNEEDTEFIIHSINYKKMYVSYVRILVGGLLGCMVTLNGIEQKKLGIYYPW